MVVGVIPVVDVTDRYFVVNLSYTLRHYRGGGGGQGCNEGAITDIVGKRRTPEWRHCEDDWWKNKKGNYKKHKLI